MRGQAIRALRGLQTQEEFAKVVGDRVTNVLISRWENGSNISLRYKRRLVELGLDPVYVLPESPVAAGAGQEISRRTA